MEPVTDPALLEQLNSPSLKPVTDPAILAQLNGKAPAAAAESHPLQDALDGLASPFKALGHDVMRGYRDKVAQATAPLPSLPQALKRTVSDITGPLKVAGDVANLTSAPVQAVTHPLARALAAHGPQAYQATLQGPKALQGDEASNAIEGAMNTAMMGARPKGAVLAEALAKTPAPISAADAPSIAALRTQSGALYEKAKAAGFEVKAPVYQDFANSLKAKLEAEGIDEDLQPKATAALRRVSGAGNGNIDLTTLDNLRKISTNATAASAGNPADKRLTRMITDHIDSFVGDLKPGDVHSGDPEAASSMLGEARSLWKQQAKGQVIEDLIAKAKNNASGIMNLDGALRSQFQKLVNSKNGMAQFSPDEQVAIMKVAGGAPFDQTMFHLGKLSPKDAHLTIPQVALAPLGIPAKVISTINTSRNAKLASALMRRGGQP